MLSNISIEYYQYDPELTSSKTLIYGRLVGSAEDDVDKTVRTNEVPGNATYCSILVQQGTCIEIGVGTPSVLAGRRFSMATGERRDFMIGPQQSDTITIGYREAI